MESGERITEATLLDVCHSEFAHTENYLRGLQFSPDGAHLLSCSNDNIMRVFRMQLPPDSAEERDLLPDVCVNVAQPVFDFCWHPSSTLFATSTKHKPVHVWSLSGRLHTSVLIRNHVEEVVNPHCMAFDREGSRIFCGFNKMLRIVNLNRPNDIPVCRALKDKSSVATQPGIISSIAMTDSLYSLTSYSGSIGIYDLHSGIPVSILQGGHGGSGFNQVKFSKDGNLLFSNCRKDDSLCVWDLRRISEPLIRILSRPGRTNQRICFDLDASGERLVSGSTSGHVFIFDLRRLGAEETPDCQQSTAIFKAHEDSVNSIACHPTAPAVLASGSGCRHYLSTRMACADSEEEEEEEEESAACCVENSLKLWTVVV